MRRGKMRGKVFGIVLVFVLIGVLLGGLSGTPSIASADGSNDLDENSFYYLTDREKDALSYVEECAERYSVGPALIMAIIRKETHPAPSHPDFFNPNARGDYITGYNGDEEPTAFGYMQVRWPAAYDVGFRGTERPIEGELKKRYDWFNENCEDLWGGVKPSAEKFFAYLDWPDHGIRPDENVDYGTHYINWLRSRIEWGIPGYPDEYNDILKSTISAYNAGRPWLGNKESYVEPVIRYCRDYSIKLGLRWLEQHQNPDGSWYYTNLGGGKIKTVGLTALATTAFLNYGIEESHPAVSEGLNFILSSVDDEDGSITTGGWPVYDTSLAVLALLATDNQGEYGDEVTNAVGYLRDAQTTDGGWAYEVSEGGSDLSNTQFALLALYEARSKGWVGIDSVPDTVFSDAATFVSSCQNPDGGFTYWPEGSPWAPGSYGSMTAAGIWSLKCCGVSDAIDDALDWLANNYHIDQNHPIGNAWLYYYQYTLAKALIIPPQIRNESKELDGHDWYQDLSSWLANEQRSDGSWLNPWPGMHHGFEKEEMATSQAILALETKAPPLVPRSVRVTVDSPADLHVYDPEGRHVGINYETGEVEIEIPGATYSGPGTEPQIIHITDPAAGTYRIEMIGISAGDWTLTVQGFIGEDVVSTTSYSGSISPGQKYESTATVSAIAGAVTIDTTDPESINHPPFADAGPDQTVYVPPQATTAEVSLDGSGSYDPDGDPLTYTWTWDGNTARGVNPTIELPLGTTTVTLVVNDGELSDSDTVDITVEQRAAPPAPAVGGEAYPPNKLAVLAPWLALAMFLIGGISWFTLRRRRAQS